MKKLFALLLALLMLAGVAVGCVSGNVTPADSTNKVGNSGSTGDDSADDEFKTSVPDDMNCEGFEYVILNSKIHEIAGLLNDIFIEYSTELDSVSDAMYRRNSAIEEQYDVTLSEIVDGSGIIVGKVRDSQAAGTDDYALVNVIGNLIYTMAADGLLYNLKYLDYVDLSKPWWTQGSVSDFSIRDQLYYASSDLTICDDEGTCIIMYNEVVAQNYNLETPDEMYDLVANGEWTWDKMFSQAKTVGTGGDNGDGKLSDGDKFGIIACDWSYIGMMCAAEQRFSTKDENDIPRISFGSEEFVNVLDQLVEFTKDKRAFLVPLYDGQFTENHFGNNNALMIMQVIAHIRNSRAMESDFAVVPMPKLNEEQEDYYSYVNRVTYVGVPVTITQKEWVGGITEALTAKSREIVIPDYYDVALSERFMRDEGSKRMIQYIFGHTVYDQLVSTTCWDTTFGAFTSMVKSRKNMVTVVEAKYSKGINSIIEEVADAYAELARDYE